jgi:hypothetical protein
VHTYFPCCIGVINVIIVLIRIDKYKTAASFAFIPRLMNALNAANLRSILFNAIYILMESTLRISSPVVLGLLLSALEDPSSPPYWAYVLAVVLGLMNLMQTFLHGWSFLFAYKVSCTTRPPVLGFN